MSKIVGLAGLGLAAIGLAHRVKPDAFESITARAFPENTQQHLYMGRCRRDGARRGLGSAENPQVRTHLHRPPAPPIPARGLKLGALVLRTDPALGLTGRHATSKVLPREGFEFAFPTLDSALSDLLGGCAPQ